MNRVARFAIGESEFLLDGRPHRILAGALHYFRVHPEQWADRIRKARLMGLNTIETYVAWNFHEPVRGEWEENGWKDLGRFLDLVAEEGMHAIVRPGPYICAEWHNGGLPAWLTSMPGIRLRSSDPLYLTEVAAYLRTVYSVIAPRQIDRGGNVVLVQIENEYGAYGSDKQYLHALVELARDAGITVPLTTVDQPLHDHLRDGSLPGVHMTGSFGSRVRERLAALREHQPTGPLMCAEFWNGWFDWWGGHHHVTSAAAAANELEDLLAAGASVSIYMFHGGSNFGLTNGANDKGKYLPIVTSYDYDAPLSEAGHPTEKFWALREVLGRYTDLPEETPPTAPDAPSFSIPLHAAGDWRSTLRGSATVHENPPTFDELDHVGALLVYEAVLPPEAFGGGGPKDFTVGEVRDQAWVSVDGRPVGTMSRSLHQNTLAIPRGESIRLFVEDQGRVTYGPRIGEAKGLIGEARLDGIPVRGWRVLSIDMADPTLRRGLAESMTEDAADVRDGDPPIGPSILRGRFDLSEACDLHLDTAGWGKGYAYINGFLLGRYWSSGPQRTLYVPAPVTLAGRNEVVRVELEGTTTGPARFVPRPMLGPIEE